MDVISMIGALASILAAIYTFFLSKKAREYAEEAKNQFAKGRKITELSMLKNRWEETYILLAPFGPSATATDLRGKSPNSAARKAQDYVVEISNCSSSLQGLPDLSDRTVAINALISQFSEAKDDKELKKSGSKLLSEICDLNAAIYSVLVSERENISLI